MTNVRKWTIAGLCLVVIGTILLEFFHIDEGLGLSGIGIGYIN